MSDKPESELEQQIRNIAIDANGSELSPPIVKYLLNLITRESAKYAKEKMVELPRKQLSPLGMRHDEKYSIVYTGDIDAEINRLNRIAGEE